MEAPAPCRCRHVSFLRDNKRCAAKADTECLGHQVLGEHDASVKGMLEEFGVFLKPSDFQNGCTPAC